MAEAFLASLLTNTLWTVYGNEVEKVSDRLIAKAVRALQGDPGLPKSDNLKAALVRCWTLALKHVCRCYDSSSGTISERLYLKDMANYSDRIAKAGIKADLGDFDKRQFRAALLDQSPQLGRANTLTLIAHLEDSLGAMPQGIRLALLEGISPDCPKWDACFSLFVNEQIGSSPELFQVFTAERLTNIESVAVTTAQISHRIELGLERISQRSDETGHDVRWIVERLQNLQSMNDTDLNEIAAFFGIEPPRVCRRPWVVSYAAISRFSAAA